MKIRLTLIAILFCNLTLSQNVGIGVTNPVEKLEVNGKLRTDALTISTGGTVLDFLIKSDGQGTVGYRKGHGGLTLNYIICYSGLVPSPTGGIPSEGPYIGDIRLFAGNFAPLGWKLCDGQFLKKDSVAYSALYSIIGNTYGSTTTTFAVPDLRGSVPVGVGTSPAGYSWSRGQKTN